MLRLLDKKIRTHQIENLSQRRMVSWGNLEPNNEGQPLYRI